MRNSTTLINPVPYHIKPPQTISENNKEALDAIKRINARNASIRSLECHNITIRVNCPGTPPVNLKSEMAYEKDKKFRMINQSVLGREADVGSNDQQFWFWSKRMRPPTLYYANHSDMIKVPLRDPLNPLWLMECMNVQEIATKNTEIRQQEKYWAIHQTRVSLLGALVVKMTLIDPQEERIVGHYLYNSENKLIASSEIVAFAKCGSVYVPTEMKMCWHEENMSMLFQFTQIAVNTKIKDTTWILPNYLRKKNMAELLP